MAKFPGTYFTRQDVRVRAREEYRSAPIAEKFLGLPKGVYEGFVPSLAGDTLLLDPSPSGFSVARLPSGLNPAGLTVVLESQVQLDFSAAAPGETPAYVVLSADYANPTVGKIEARAIPQVTGEVLATIGTFPASLDLATVQIAGLPVRRQSVTISVTHDVLGPLQITDDGQGNLVGPSALTTEGTIDYRTGALTGVTDMLAAGSQVLIDYQLAPLPHEVLLCVVSGAPGSLAVSSAVPFDRDVPEARGTLPYGFMPAGSVETMESVVSAGNDVVAARTGLDGTAYASLADRLAADAGGQEVAERLALQGVLVEGNKTAVPSGAQEVPVGDSLTRLSRAFPPALDFPGGGSETTLGAVTQAPGNVCPVLDATTREIAADATTGDPVFGRLEGPDTVALAGQVTFTQASTTISGADTTFTSVLAPGDLVAGPDGILYAVKSVTNDLSAELAAAYQGATTTASVSRQRYTLRFFRAEAGSEVAASPSSAEILFLFPAFVRLHPAAFRGENAALQPGSAPGTPPASTTTAGHVALAEANGRVGSILVMEAGTPVGRFTSIDFTDGTVVETDPGVVDVQEIGPQGPQGPPGATGGAGPKGPPGDSFNAFALSEFDQEVDAFAPPGGLTITFTRDVGHEVRAAYGWFARVRCQAGTVFDPTDEVEITDISASGTTATVECFVTASSRVSVTLYLSTAGIA